MDPGDVVRSFWEAMDRRAWDDVAALLASDARFDWPQSGERILGAANVVAVNRHYPGDWRLHVEQVLAAGEEVAARVRIPLGGGDEWCAGFYTVRGGRIARAVELWGEPFPPAPWRAAWVEVGPAPGVPRPRGGDPSERA